MEPDHWTGNYVYEGTRNSRATRKFEKIMRERGEYRCAGVGCSLPDGKPIWAGRPLKLQVDHINGVSTDDSWKNLRLLCPNCHSQTENYAGRNKGLVETVPGGFSVKARTTGLRGFILKADSATYRIGQVAPTVVIHKISKDESER